MGMERRPTGRVPAASDKAPARPPAAHPITSRVPPPAPRPITSRIPPPAPTPALGKVIPPPKPTKTTTRIQQAIAGPKTGRLDRATSRVGTTSRPVPVQKKSNAMLFAGIGGGALLLIIVIAVAASGGPSPAREAAPSRAKAPVNVADLETEGMRKCDEGVVAVQRAYDINDKAGLQRGVQLITEGNQLLDRAYQLSNNKYDTTRYNQTLKMARSKLLELK